jgi:hypothetical protein
MLTTWVMLAALLQAPAGWQPLFDGKTLTGWTSAAFRKPGQVRVEQGALVLVNGYPLTGVNLTRDFPKVNYELRWEAARRNGGDFFSSLTFPYLDSHATFVAGGWGGDIIGISSIEGLDAADNETRNYFNFENGRWYKFRLKVTTARIEAWIDEQPLVNLAVEGRTIALRPGEIEASRPFGFASYNSTGALRNIEYRLVKP